MNWHQAVPISFHLSLVKIEGDDLLEGDHFIGDYILMVREQSPWGCRWELPITHSLQYQKIALVIKPVRFPEFVAHTFLEGTEPGPKWMSSGIMELDSPMAFKWNGHKDRVIAGIRWPERLAATPLKTIIPGQGHLLSPLISDKEAKQ